MLFNILCSEKNGKKFQGDWIVYWKIWKGEETSTYHSAYKKQPLRLWGHLALQKPVLLRVGLPESWIFHILLQKILRAVIEFYPCKISCHQHMLPSDAQQSLGFVLTFLARMRVDDAFSWKILQRDEVYFPVNGRVNTMNCRKGESESLNVTDEIFLPSPKITVGCGFTANFLLDPHFFRCSGQQALQRVRLLRMLQTFVVP